MSAKGSELKRVRQSRKSNLRNRHYKSQMNTAIKKFLSSDKKQAENDFPNGNSRSWNFDSFIWSKINGKPKTSQMWYFP